MQDETQLCIIEQGSTMQLLETETRVRALSAQCIVHLSIKAILTKVAEYCQINDSKVNNVPWWVPADFPLK